MKLRVSPGTQVATLRSAFSLRPTRGGELWGIAALALVFAITLSASPSLAKKKRIISKTVSGQVLDPNDNGIDGAAVMLKDLQTGKTSAVYTRDGGQYQFTGLDMHHDYEVHARMKGVDSETQQVSSIDERERLTINLTIPPPKS